MDTKTTIQAMSLTSIKIQGETRDRLVELGKKNESYDTLINKLVDFWETHPYPVNQKPRKK